MWDLTNVMCFECGKKARTTCGLSVRRRSSKAGKDAEKSKVANGLSSPQHMRHTLVCCCGQLHQDSIVRDAGGFGSFTSEPQRSVLIPCREQGTKGRSELQGRGGRGGTQSQSQTEESLTTTKLPKFYLWHWGHAEQGGILCTSHNPRNKARK